MQPSPSPDRGLETYGALTRAEIFQQPELWLTTLENVSTNAAPDVTGSVVVTGAGSSAYAASAVAASWPGSRAIPTTDLLLDPKSAFDDRGLLVSVARSGDSPESVAVVQKVQREFPQVKHVAITCNQNGALASAPGVDAIVLDPRTNDRSLVMTSSYSNLVLAGMTLNHRDTLNAAANSIARRVDALLPEFDRTAEKLAARGASRVVVLGSGPFIGAANEASLKILEMTAGSIVALPETFLGLRHGPMSFLRRDAFVLCFRSSDSLKRRYEQDLLEELKRKELGYIIAIDRENTGSPDTHVPAVAPDLPDYLRTPFEIVFPQLLAYHLSLKAGLNPDSPSPSGVITRVVEGVRIHEQ
jgi:tagatose-6-phosphate ketose/aldose isomerase